jgi:TPR repeat protein
MKAMPLRAFKHNDSPPEMPAGIARMADQTLPKRAAGRQDASVFLQLGMMHMTGQNVPVDLVAAHKFFNLAAMNGDEVAIRLRREIAREMSQSEIATAQRAAREWRFALDD